nr:DUF2339 domain-containing protein [Corynebacterium lactis]
MNAGNNKRDPSAELSAALADLERSSNRVAEIARLWRSSLADGADVRPVHSADRAQWAASNPREGASPDRVDGIHDWKRHPAPEQIAPAADTTAPAAPSAPFAPTVPTTPPKPWWTNEKQIVRIIATFGGIITAAGIAFFVAVAIQAGLLGPAGRVVLAYALAAGLAGTSVWAHRRQASPAGVTALMATALATATLTSMSLWGLLHWVSAPVAMVVMLAFTCIGFYGARWAQSSATAAWSVIIGGGLLAVVGMNIDGEWISFGDVLAHATLLLLAPAGTAILWGRGLRPYVSGFLLGANIIAGYQAIHAGSAYLWLGICYVAIFAAAQFGPILLADQAHAARLFDRSLPAPIPAAVPAPIHVATPAATGNVPVAAATNSAPAGQVPTWSGRQFLMPIIAAVATPVVIAASSGLAWPFFIASVIAILFAVGGIFVVKPTLRYFGPVVLAASPIPMVAFAYMNHWYGQFIWETNLWPIIPVSLIATVATWLLFAWPLQRAPHYTRLCALSAGIAWFIAANITHLYLLPAITTGPATKISELHWEEALSLALLLAADIGLIAAVARRKAKPAFALVALAVAALPFIHLLMLVGLGFSLSHMLLSITWATLAGALVLSPRFRHIQARLAAGLTIAALAIIKLIFFDMATLDGVTRAAAFIVCGLILLAMAISGAKQRSASPGQPSPLHGHGRPGDQDLPGPPEQPEQPQRSELPEQRL